MDLFSFNFKECGIDPGETPNDTPTLTILDDFCAAENFVDIVTAPADPASIGGTGATSFDNFDFTIFKFPGEEKGNAFSKLNISKYYFSDILVHRFHFSERRCRCSRCCNILPKTSRW